jgi:outer membrane receptor protein involved in Fe transport
MRKQTVQPSAPDFTPTLLTNDYWLPAATITWNFARTCSCALHASKTIARPQFRELAPQIFQDFESDREFTGNPFLTDSELFNAEARYEWYFARGQRFSLAGFYKKIDNPIEAAAFFAGGGQLRTGFANAPEATCTAPRSSCNISAAEGLGGFFSTRKRLLLIGNYTYTKSEAEGGRLADHRPGPAADRGANLLFQRRRAADRAVRSSRQSADRHRGYGPDQPGDLPAHLCQRARHQSRPDPGLERASPTSSRSRASASTSSPARRSSCSAPMPS